MSEKREAPRSGSGGAGRKQPGAAAIRQAHDGSALAYSADAALRSSSLRSTRAASAAKAGSPSKGAAGPDDSEILEQRGEVAQSLIDIAARDQERTAEDEEALRRERERKRDTFYSDLIFTLASIRYPEDEARLVWVNLLTHKAEMSTLLGRNVGIRVAALDFFRNKFGVLGDVKIMSSSEYIETAKLAVTDGLTGVYNHRYFQERLASTIRRAEREHLGVSLLMVDIDFFKKYNDTNGHVAGDIALREVASTLAGHLTGDDVLARYGGEEFTLILWRASKAEALELAELLRVEVEGLAVANEQSMPGGNLTISIGVATYPDDASDRGGLIDWADLSLYLAKTGGRNRVASCPADRRHVGRETADLAAELRRAGADPSLGRRVHVVDIGRGGLAIAGEDLPSSGTRVEVTLSGGGLDKEITLRGRVAWRRPESRLGEIIGVQFTAVAAKTAGRVLRWVDKGKSRVVRTRSSTRPGGESESG